MSGSRAITPPYLPTAEPMTKSDLKLYSALEVENARTKAQVVGIAQGAGGMLLLGVLLSLIGWIPLLVVGALAVFVVMKLVSK